LSHYRGTARYSLLDAKAFEIMTKKKEEKKRKIPLLGGLSANPSFH
jgi:hypothetical protein